MSCKIEITLISTTRRSIPEGCHLDLSRSEHDSLVGFCERVIESSEGLLTSLELYLQQGVI